MAGFQIYKEISICEILKDSCLELEDRGSEYAISI